MRMWRKKNLLIVFLLLIFQTMSNSSLSADNKNAPAFVKLEPYAVVAIHKNISNGLPEDIEAVNSLMLENIESGIFSPVSHENFKIIKTIINNCKKHDSPFKAFYILSPSPEFFAIPESIFCILSDKENFENMPHGKHEKSFIKNGKKLAILFESNKSKHLFHTKYSDTEAYNLTNKTSFSSAWINSQKIMPFMALMSVAGNNTSMLSQVLSNGNLFLEFIPEKNKSSLSLKILPFAKDKGVITKFIDTYNVTANFDEKSFSCNLKAEKGKGMTNILKLSEIIEPNSYKSMRQGTVLISYMTGSDFIRDILGEINDNISITSQTLGDKKSLLRFSADLKNFNIFKKNLLRVIAWSNYFSGRNIFNMKFKETGNEDSWKAYNNQDTYLFDIYLQHSQSPKIIIEKPSTFQEKNSFPFHINFNTQKDNDNTYSLNLTTSSIAKARRHMEKQSNSLLEFANLVMPLINYHIPSRAEYALTLLVNSQIRYRALQLGKYNNLPRDSFQPDIKMLYYNVDSKEKRIKLIPVNIAIATVSSEKSFYNLKFGTVKSIDNSPLDFQKECYIFAEESNKTNTPKTYYLINSKREIFVNFQLESAPYNIKADLTAANWHKLHK